MCRSLEILEVSSWRVIHVFFSNLRALFLSSNIQFLFYPAYPNFYVGVVASCSRELRRSELLII